MIKNFMKIKDKLISCYTSNEFVRNTKIRKAIFAVHGSSLDGEYACKLIKTLADEEGVLNKTFIMAPEYKTGDLCVDPNEWWFGISGWKYGNSSTNDGISISSYDVVDEFIRVCEQIFPNIQQIVIVGHSAGGQFVHRYALLSPYKSIPVRYIGANPSMYVFLSERRLNRIENKVEYPLMCDETGTLKFKDTFPEGGLRFWDYNNYPYGLDSKNTYGRRVDTQEQLRDFIKKDVIYMIGSNDTDPNDPWLNKTDRAQLQGPDRYTRCLTYYDLLNQYNYLHNHTLAIVDGIGHSASGMYGSSNGRKYIFH